MANLLPIPRDAIAENHMWREWFNKIRGYVSTLINGRQNKLHSHPDTVLTWLNM